jgi:predicted metal-binding membrane protein
MLKRNHLIILSGLVGVIVVAWVYIFHLAQTMTNPIAMGMETQKGLEMMKQTPQAWGVVAFLVTFTMWTVMQLAMMAPAAIPMVLMFSRINEQRHQQQSPFLLTVIFFLGYILVWTAFGAGATLTQWGLQTTELLSSMLVSTSPLLSGVILIAAGVFQFTPLKHACLARCRSPLGFFMTEWREGTKGALMMGLRHGSYCVGCCWLLMALLFVAGLMNLLWIALIAGYVLIEKVGPAGRWVSQVMGLLMVGWGIWLLSSTSGM